MSRLLFEALGEISEFLPDQSIAWICAAPQARRSQERSTRGLRLGRNRYHQAGVSSFRKQRRTRLRCDVNDVQGVRLTRWWLQKCSGASQVDEAAAGAAQGSPLHCASGLQLRPPPRLSRDTECPLSVCCWGSHKATAASKNETANTAMVPQLSSSLGDLLSLGRIECLEINGATLPFTPVEWQSCLAVSRGVEEFRIKAGTVPLNELLSFLYSNGSTLQAIEVAGVALPRLQIFALAPRIEEVVLRNVTVHPQSVIVTSSASSEPPAGSGPPSTRIPLSDLATLRNLRRLDLINCKADFDCCGIGRCTLLRSVLLSGCSISDADIVHLGALRRVEELLLARTKVTNVQPLAAIEDLRFLQLSNTLVNSAGIEGLQTMPNLARLDLSSTPVTDVNCLGRSHCLVYLNVSKTGVTSEGIRELQNLATLEHLVLNENGIRDVSFLSYSRSLKTLSLQSTLVDTAGIDGFHRLKTLQDLCLAHTRVTSVAELQKCESLWRLDLQGTLVDEAGIAGLEQLPCLRVLLLSQTDVTDLGLVLESASIEQLEVKFSRVAEPNPFSSLTKQSPLRELVVTHCEVTDVNDLGRCRKLATLNLWQTKVTSEGIAGLSEATALQEVDLAETEVADITPLLSCTQLRTLTLYKTALQSIRGIESLCSLRRLDVADTCVSSIEGLGECRHLEILNISNTRIDDDGFKGIEKAYSLKSVLLSFTAITHLGALGRCSLLEEVHAQSCPVTSDGIVGLEKAFRLVKLNLSYTKIQGNIGRFADCLRLQKLNVKFTYVPFEEVQYLEMCLPHCRVMNDAAQRVRKDVKLAV